MGTNILSFDGGGIRGILSCKILDLIDENIEEYDVFCGVSTGSMIACALASGYTPLEIKDFYVNRAEKIFPMGMKRWLNHLRRMFIFKDISVSMYETQPLHDLLYEIFGDKTMGELDNRVFVLTYNLTRDTPVLIDSFDKTFKDYRIVDVCLMSSSAPTFFDPYQYKNDLYIDGSVVTNRIAFLCTEIICDVDRITEIGTGIFTDKKMKNKVRKNMGGLDWALLIVNVFLNNAKLNSYLLYMSDKINYTRHDVFLHKNIKLDTSHIDDINYMRNISLSDIITITNTYRLQRLKNRKKKKE